MDRECYKCVYYTNTCTKWGCQFETLEEHDKQIRAEMSAEVLKKVYKHFEQHNKVVFDKYEILDEISQIVDEYYIYFEMAEQLKENK